MSASATNVINDNAHAASAASAASTADLGVDTATGFESPIEAEYDDVSPHRSSNALGGAFDPNADPTLAGPGGSEGQQKRRRVTRACDECRKKKIKCDGKQACNHCIVYGYECTYDQPSHRRRNAAPHVVEQLERRLQRAEALLRVFLPAGKDPSDPGLDALIESQQPSQSDAASINSIRAANQPSPSSTAPTNDATLESMVRATANLDLDENGTWEYKGHSSGLSFIRSMRAQFGDIFGSDDPDGLKTFASPARLSETRASPDHFRPSVDSPFDTSIQEVEDLPVRERALALCHDAIEDAGAIILVVHKPTFYNSVSRIYSKGPADYDAEDQLFLPLLYSVLAVGCLFCHEENGDITERGYEALMAQGYKYFWAARRLLDVVDCREMVSLQALVFMTYFLQCSARLSVCYTFVGLALRTAMRMGLHRTCQGDFTPIESETRKRVFWVIRKFDVHVGTMTGLPQALTEDEIDQVFPTAVNDEYITKDCILPMPEGEICTMAAANANFRMTEILRKVVKYIYPIKGFQDPDSDVPSRYRVSVSKIHEIETDLQKWLDDLPPAFKPGEECPDNIYRVRSLLRMSYALAQLMLYRPFLHYVSNKHPKSSTDHRSYACAAASVGIARNVIHITADMKKRGLLVGSYWFSMYTTFFAILTLIYYILENLDDATTPELWRDALEGREALAALSRRSMAADRCTMTLNRLFRYAENAMQTRKGQVKNSIQRRKRQSTAATDVPVKTEHSPPPTESTKRTSTFPQSVSRKSREMHLAPKPHAVGGLAPAQALLSESLTPNSQDAGSLNGYSPAVDSSHGVSNQNSFNPYAYGPSMSDQNSYDNQYDGGGAYSGKLTDMASMMFPTTDPFAYPKQPMLTLEQQMMSAQRGDSVNLDGWNLSQYSAPPQQMGSSFANDVSRAADDHLDVHMLGPLPDYLTDAPAQQQSMDSKRTMHPQDQIFGLPSNDFSGSMQGLGGGANPQRGSLDFQTFSNVWPQHTPMSAGQGIDMYTDESWRQAHM